MSKIPCAKCRFYSGNHYLICAVVPGGPDGQECNHFEEGSDNEPKKELELLDYSLIFSDFCPQCGYMFQRDCTSLVHRDCPVIYTQNNNNLTRQEFYFVDTFYQDKNF